MNIHSNLQAHLGTVHVQPPKPGVAGGMHGVVDLSKLRLTMNMKADGKLPPGVAKPNKLIGQGKIEVTGHASSTAKCVGSVGGYTVYASNVKMILGDGIKITGTKYCAPGSSIGFGGSSKSNQDEARRGTQNELNIGHASAAANEGGGDPGMAHAYQGSAITQQTPQGETRPASSSAGAATQSKKPGSGSGGDEKFGSRPAQQSGQGSGGGGAKGGGSGDPGTSGAAIADDASTDRQQSLQKDYESLASGEVHRVDDEKGFAIFQGGGPGAPTREPHLPASHGDPTDRVLSGGSVSGVQKGLKQGERLVQPSPERTQFVLSPSSVGSHSTRGTVPWTPDSPKKSRRKHGLLGEYFLGADFEQRMLGRRDKNIDFTWTGEIVDPGLPTGNPFSVRWTGYLKPRFSEMYTLYTTSDDGVRLWLGDRLLISNWSIHAATEDVTRVQLQAGREYPIRLEYFEKNGYSNEIIKLYWESASQPKEYIPENCLLYPR